VTGPDGTTADVDIQAIVNVAADVIAGLGAQAIINATDAVEIRAEVDSAKTSVVARNTSSEASGRQSATADNRKNINVQVIAAPGSQITTPSLTVQALVPRFEPGGFVREVETGIGTNSQSVTQIVGVDTTSTQTLNGLPTAAAETTDTITATFSVPVALSPDQVYLGREDITNSIQFDATLDLGGDVNPVEGAGSGPPRVEIDGDGTILSLNGLTLSDGLQPLVVGEQVTTGNLIIGPAVSNRSASAEFTAPGGSVSGQPNVRVFNSLSGVDIVNRSNNNVILEGIDVVNPLPSASQLRIQSATGGDDFGDVVGGAGNGTPPVVSVFNQGSGDVIIRGAISNPQGITQIHNTGGGGIRREAAGRITTRQLDLRADSAAIGAAGSGRIPVDFTTGGSLLPAVTQAFGQNGVHLNLVGHTAVSELLNLNLDNLGSSEGDVDVQFGDGVRAESTTQTTITLNNSGILQGTLRDLSFTNGSVDTNNDTVNFAFEHGLTVFDPQLLAGGANGGRRVPIVPVTPQSVLFGLTFDASTDADGTTDEFTSPNPHFLLTGDQVTYSAGGNSTLNGLTDGQRYFVRVLSPTRFKLAASHAQATSLPLGFTAWRDVNGDSDTVRFRNGHTLTTNDTLVYHTNGGTAIGGLTDGGTYYAVVVNSQEVRLAATPGDASASPPVIIDLEPTAATGDCHTFSASFNVTTGVITLDGGGTGVTITSSPAFVTGDAIIYRTDGLTEPIGGLLDGEVYFVRVIDSQTIGLTLTFQESMLTTSESLIPLSPGTDPDSSHSIGLKINPVPQVNSQIDTIGLNAPHGFATGDPVTYRAAGGAIGGLTSGVTYYAIVLDASTVQLAATPEAALAGTPLPIDFNTGSAGQSHSLGSEGVDFNSDGASGIHSVRLDLDLVSDPDSPTGSSLLLGGQSAGSVLSGEQRLLGDSLYLDDSITVQKVRLADVANLAAQAEASSSAADTQFTLGGVTQQTGNFTFAASDGLESRTDVVVSSPIAILIGLLRVDAGNGSINTEGANGLLSGQQISLTGNSIGTSTQPLNIDGLGGTVSIDSFFDVFVSEVNGDLLAGSIVSQTGDVSLHSAGAIQDAVPAGGQDPVAAVTGGHITLTAQSVGTEANPFDILAGPNSLTVQSQFGVYIDQLQGDLHVVKARSEEDNVVLTARQGSILVNKVEAPLGVAALVASDSVVDNLNDANSNIDARVVSLAGTSGSVGTVANPIEFNSSLQSEGGFRATAGTGIHGVETAGTLRLFGATVTGAGAVNLVVNRGNASVADLILPAVDNPEIRTTLGNVTLAAADSIRIADTSTIAAGGFVQITVGTTRKDANAAGAEFEIGGQIDGFNVLVNGSVGRDTFTLRNVRAIQGTTQIELLGDTGADFFDVQPVLAAPLHINGNDPLTGPDGDRLIITTAGTLDLACGGNSILVTSTVGAQTSGAVTWENIEQLDPLSPSAGSGVTNFTGDNGGTPTADVITVVGANVDGRLPDGDADGAGEFYLVCGENVIPVRGTRTLNLNTLAGDDRVTIEPWADNVAPGAWDIDVRLDLGAGTDDLVYGNTTVIAGVDEAADGSVAAVSEDIVLAPSGTPGAGQVRVPNVATLTFTGTEDVSFHLNNGAAGDSDTLQILGTNFDDIITVDLTATGTDAAPLVDITRGQFRLLQVEAFTNVSALSVAGGLGADVFNVTPGAISVFIDGGDPIGFGDRLNIVAASATNRPGPQNDEGAWEIPGASSVSYDRIESTVLNGQTPPPELPVVDMNSGMATLNLDGDTSDDLTIAVVGGRTQLSDASRPISSGDETSQVDPQTVEFNEPPTDVTINGGEGDDTLTIDLRNGNPLNGGTLTFNGGAGGNDKLVIIDDNGRTVISGRYTPDIVNGGDGVHSLDLAGGGTLTITFTGLEPTVISGIPNYTFQSPGSVDVITVGAIVEAGAAALTVSGTSDGVTFESLFLYDVASFTIDLGTNDTLGGGSGNDTLTIVGGLEDGVDIARGLQNLSIDLGTAGTGDVDSLTISSTLDVPGFVSIDGAVINSNSSIGRNVNIGATANLSPGPGTAQLTVGDLQFTAGATVSIEVESATPGTGFDQLLVNGMVDLSGATLNLDASSSTVTGGTSLVIIDNDGADAVAGTFTGLAEGAIFQASGNTFRISYTGGDGNDVVLTKEEANLPIARIDGPTSPVTEGENAVFTITLNETSSDSVTVVLSIGDGTATASGGDYAAIAAPGVAPVVTFAPGETSKTVSIPINADGTKEADETFFVSLVSGLGAFLDENGGSSATATIEGSQLLIASVADQQIAPGRSAVDLIIATASSDNAPASLTTSALPAFVSFTDNGNGTGVFTFTPTSGDVAFSGEITLTATDGNGSAQETFNLAVVSAETTLPAAPLARINAGGGAVGTFSSDRFANTGNAFSTRSTIDVSGVAADVPASLFQTTRWDGRGGSELVYSIPAAAGNYQVNLFFAEIYGPTSRTGGRVFDVTIEGNLVLDDFDVFATAGTANKAIVQRFNVTSDGMIDVLFGHVVENPDVMGIEVIDLNPIINQGPALGTRSPVTITAGDSKTIAVTASDADGEVITLTANGLPAFASFTDSGNGTGAIAVNSTRDDAGEFPITVQAESGGQPVSDSASFLLTVNPPAVSDGVKAKPQFGGSVTNGGTATATNGIRIDGPTGPVAEGDNAVFTVSLDAPAVSNVTVTLNINDGTATQSAGDFLPLSNRDVGTAIVFLPGEQVKRVSIATTQDNVFESDETFSVSLGTVLGATIDAGNSSAPATIKGASLAISPIADQTVSAGTAPVDLQISSTSSDGLPAMLSVTGLPGYATFTDNGDGTGTFTITATSSDVSDTSTIQITATDSNTSTMTAFDLNVVATEFTGQATSVFRINAGGAAVETFSGDRFANTGNAYSTRATINTSDPSVPVGTPAALFQTTRWDARGGAELSYDIPTGVGDFEVRLYFAEIYGPTARVGGRVFDVSIEGETVLDDFDVFAAAGAANKGIVRSFDVTSDGTLNIDFGHVVENPNIMAIEIIDKTPIADAGPVVNRVADQSVSKGSSLSIPVSAFDENGDAIMLSLLGLPAFADFVDNRDGTGVISVNPQDGDDGDFVVSVNAESGNQNLTDSTSIRVSVQDTLGGL
jgi:hypothetical protein